MKQKKRNRLVACREFYAKMAASAGGPVRELLERAFQFVPREHFLGQGPWLAMSPFNQIYVPTPTDDPIHLYQNLLFALDAERHINNGEPFLHGQLLGALSPDRGHVVIHIGCGTGYYTAILAQLVGPSGRIIAYEINSTLAGRAKENLAPWDNVEVRHASGVADDLPRCDAIYVNAGATRPASQWLDALNERGKLVFPFVGVEGAGVGLLVARLKDSYRVRVLGYCGFVQCADAFDADEADRITVAFRTGRLRMAQSLVRGEDANDTVVLVGKGWWLSSSPPQEARNS
jgi:protein-L-isoaspartate(D-aspartate) O-methyltransferase